MTSVRRLTLLRLRRVRERRLETAVVREAERRHALHMAEQALGSHEAVLAALDQQARDLNDWFAKLEPALIEPALGWKSALTERKARRLVERQAATDLVHERRAAFEAAAHAVIQARKQLDITNREIAGERRLAARSEANAAEVEFEDRRGARVEGIFAC